MFIIHQALFLCIQLFDETFIRGYTNQKRLLP